MREAGRETGRGHRYCQRGHKGKRTQSGGQGWGVSGDTIGKGRRRGETQRNGRKKWSCGGLGWKWSREWG